MGAIMNAMRQPERVDFKAVSAAASKSMDAIVQRYLPNARRVGGEWEALNPSRGDNHTGSFKINPAKGVFSDFATGQKGDAIDLVALVTGKNKLDAARELADFLRVAPTENSTTLTGNVKLPAPARRGAAALSPAESEIAPTAFPSRTPPNEANKPRFVAAGEDGPRVRDDEKRRHIFRQGGVPVRIKIMRQGDATPFNVYRVTTTAGVSGWQYAMPEGFRSVPYVTNGTAPFASDGALFWPEGEKDVDSVSKLGEAAFCFGGTGDGLPDGCEKYVTSRDLVILADNDDAGRAHAERKAELAAGVAARIRVVHFPELANKEDVTDWILAGNGRDALLARIEATTDWELARPAPTTTPGSADQAEMSLPPVDALEAAAETALQTTTERRSALPPGFSFSGRGLMFSDPDDLDKPAMLIAGAFDIEAETRDGDGSSWGVLLRWLDHDDREHRMALPRASLAGDGSEARRMLMDGGFYIAPSQKARGLFNSFLLQVKSPNRARATNRVGWHGNAFVLPDDYYGDKRDALLLQTATIHEHSFRQAGTLQSWQDNVARFAKGNSRLTLAISAAFAGPLIGPCSAEGGGIHFRGASSTGKSTALHVAGSVWGGGEATGYIRSWRATANGLEGVALNHCDTLLCLDELSQLAARDAGEAAYMLGNGAGKSRSSRDGSARRAAKWRVMFLSSGEISLASKVAEDGRGRKLAAGQQVRIVDLSADAGAGMGLFEDLHGFESADVFARHLRSATSQHYGVAAREYVAALVGNLDAIRQSVATLMRLFSEKFVPAGADGQIERVAQRFALVACGGEIATQLGVLPWARGDALEAAGKCFDAWLAARGGIDASEVQDGIEQVRSFLLANGMARFVPAWEDEPETRAPIRDVAGFRQKTGDGWDYFVTTDAWKEICAGLDPRRTAAALRQRGLIEGDGQHHSKKVRVPNHGRLRLYHVLSSALEDASEA